MCAHALTLIILQKVLNFRLISTFATAITSPFLSRFLHQRKNLGYHRATSCSTGMQRIRQDCGIRYWSRYIIDPRLLINLNFGLGPLHGRQHSPLWRNLMGVLYNQSSSIAFDEHLVIGQRQKALSLSAFHWSVFRNHEGSTFTKKNRNNLNHRTGPGCAGRA